MRSAVIDNSSLVYLMTLQDRGIPVLRLLRSLFTTLHLPQQVVNEFAARTGKEPRRQLFIDKLRSESGFFRLCLSYDSIVLELARGFKGIDDGEREVFAQYRKVYAHLIISDDKKFIEALNELDPTIRIYSCLHLICWLHLAGLIEDWGHVIREIHRVRPFDSATLRQAFRDMLFALGMQMPGKKISDWCSLSKWL